MYDYERDYVEPDEMINLKENGFEANVKIQFSPIAMEMAATDIVKTHIESNIVPQLKKRIEKFFTDKYGSENFGIVMEKIIREKFDEKYPDVVENKVNELAERIKNMKFDDYRSNYSGQSIREKADQVVKKYIENELALVVKVEKDKLTKFSEQYFAQNLFKAMGMMSKLTGEIEQGALK